MYTSDDVGRLSILYDTARGFVGLRDRDEIVRQTLLSLMGCCGASFAAYLSSTDEEGVFELSQGRGLRSGARLRAKLSARAVRSLREDSVHAEEAVPALGPDAKRMYEREEIRLLGALTAGDAIDGILLLGPRLLGEPYDASEAAMVAEVLELGSQALTGGRGAGRSKTKRRRSGRITSALAALREAHPVLARIRGESAHTLELFEELIALADFDLPVLINGETGTGKELVARAIHELSPRAGAPFEAINCAAIPTELVASALFGHERGAFTGAVATARGVFERAGEGTVFLDEVGDMPLETQASLLRVLQERSFRRVGGEQILPARARVISATNVELVAAVNEGTFRADLFYRIQMYTIPLRPLRERPEDIAEIVSYVLAGNAPSREAPRVTPGFLDALRARELPGNVRELEGLVLGAMVRARRAEQLEAEHLGEETASPLVSKAPRPELEPTSDPTDREDVPSYREMERQYVLSVLELTGGNKKEAAALMKIPRTTLNARMKKLGIEG